MENSVCLTKFHSLIFRNPALILAKLMKTNSQLAQKRANL